MNYWIAINRKKMGPLTLQEVSRLPICHTTYVWHTGLPEWVHASQIPEIAALLEPIATPLPAGENSPEQNPEEVTEQTTEDVTEQAPEEVTEQTPEEEEIARSTEFEQEEHADEPIPPASEATPQVSLPLPPAPVIPPPPPPAPAPPKPAPVRPKRPDSYLGWAIASLILCCLIGGIIAVIYASRVNTLYDQGDYEGAQQASERAQMWLAINITAGIVIQPFLFILSAL